MEPDLILDFVRGIMASMDWPTIIVSVLLSGMGATGFSIWSNRRSEARMIKLRLLQQLLGNRHDLHGQPFTEALNHILVIFNKSQRVMQALEAFRKIVSDPAQAINGVERQESLLKLFRALCEDAKIDTSSLSDEFFTVAFNVRRNSSDTN